jgi:hypothetical protein
MKDIYAQGKGKQNLFYSPKYWQCYILQLNTLTVRLRGMAVLTANMSSGYVDHEKCILCADAMHNSVYDNTAKNAVYLKIP